MRAAPHGPATLWRRGGPYLDDLLLRLGFQLDESDGLLDIAQHHVQVLVKRLREHKSVKAVP